MNLTKESDYEAQIAQPHRELAGSELVDRAKKAEAENINLKDDIARLDCDLREANEDERKLDERITQLEQQHAEDTRLLREAMDKFDEITEASRDWTADTDIDGDCTIRECQCSNHLARAAYAALAKALEGRE